MPVSKPQAIWRGNIRRAVTAGLLVLGLGLASAVAAPAASADSYKVAYWGPIDIQGKAVIPGGQLFGGVEGHGTKVKYAGGNFAAVGPVCAWYIDVVLINKDGQEYDSFHDDVQDCSHVGAKKFELDPQLEMENHSKIEIRLMADNGHVEVAKTVHDIEEYKPWYRW